MKGANQIHTKKKLKNEKYDQFDNALNIQSNVTIKGREGYLINIKSHSTIHQQKEQMGLMCYFQGQNNAWFKGTILLKPYFYLLFEQQDQKQVTSYIEKNFTSMHITSINNQQKLDLNMNGHLSGIMRHCLKIQFRSIGDCYNFKNIIKKDIQRSKNKDTYYKKHKQIGDYILDIREHDILYNARVCIDKKIRAGRWYKLDIKNGYIKQLQLLDNQFRPYINVMAFDIQTSKKPLRFPDSDHDQIMLISLMQIKYATLIVNTDFCGQKVQPFIYSPKQQYKTEVIIYNQLNEKACIERFFKLIKQHQIKVITSFNGDFFDWPFIQKRSKILQIDFQMSGIHQQQSQYYGRALSHLDCMYWVQRDAYLPQGSHGLKAVCRAKLDYQPIQIDPQLMTQMCRKQTQKMAQYSISDAVATYFLYMKHIHGFIFALCSIIPLSPDQVLRKGSGTLCEHLLMAQAFNRNIIFPNKNIEQKQKFYKGHLIQSETYIGGKVQCLKSGVFRKDIKCDFEMDQKAYQTLINQLSEVLNFAIKAQTKDKFNIKDVLNMKDIQKDVIMPLQYLKDNNKGKFLPLIIHLDVAAMYPNIILTNRLQPVSIVNQTICSNCLFNQQNNKCKRKMQWQWKVQYYPLNKAQYHQERDNFKKSNYQKNDEDQGKILKKKIKQSKYQQNNVDDDGKGLKKRLKQYCQNYYKTKNVQQVVPMEDIVCMRQNSFYVDTVRAFRDRRYELKAKVKIEKSKMIQSRQRNDYQSQKIAEGMMTVYQSLQLAHKIILNSFYGYVMRKGARWYSMQMAAMVTDVGSNIISQAKNWVNSIGIPLQLDTDGIWLLLPLGFPQNINIQLPHNKLTISYPCQVLNMLIYQKYKNPQYQRLLDQNNLYYSTATQMSIQFQIDGPYRAMIIPASKEKDKMLKKRYAVFKDNGKLSQLKGFQIKRRGELKIIKKFQQEIFDKFLYGNNLQQLYQACCHTAQKWLTLVKQKGKGYSQQQILNLLEQSRVLGKNIQQYDKTKGLALTTAKRMDQFYDGQFIQGKGKGIKCQYLICKYPQNAPVAERPIPKILFSAEKSIRHQYIKKWMKVDLTQYEDLLDWDYYFQRLESQIQKIIVIPAYFQNVKIPLVDVRPPQWIIKLKKDQDKDRRQNKMDNFLIKVQKNNQQKQIVYQPLQQVITPIKLVSQQSRRVIRQHINQIINPFNPYTQFQNWLKTQKEIWMKKQQGPGTSLPNMFKQSMAQNLNSKWNIIQIVQTQQPGLYKLWILTKQKIISIDVQIQRVMFHVVPGKPSNKKLPREKKQALQQMRISQTQFINQKSTFQYADRAKSQIYQIHVPLLFRLLYSLGCVCSLLKDSKLGPRFKLKQIVTHHQQSFRYINNFSQLHLIQILGTTVFGHYLWMIIDRKRYVINVFIVANFYSIQINASKVRKALQLPQDKFKIHIHHQNHIVQFMSNLGKFLYQGQLIIWSSPITVKDARALGCIQLERQMPVVTVPSTQPSSCNSIDWQSKSLSVLASQQNCLSFFIADKLQKARYSHIPIANIIDIDHSIDIIFARVLYRNNALLWYQQFPKQDKQNILIRNTQIQICKPGFYNCICVQFQIGTLAINAIQFAQTFCDDVQTSKFINQNKKNVDQEDTQSATNAFKCLRMLVKQLIQDIKKKSSKEADLILQNIYKWVSNKKSPFYDPLLLKILQKVIKNCFLYLVHVLQLCGVKVIMADYKKIIFTTQNYQIEQCKSRYNYIIDQCFTKYACFQYISFIPGNTYQCLLVYQHNNISGILQNMKYFSTYDILEVLPSQLSKTVQGFVLKYIEGMYEYRKKKNAFLKNFKQDYIQFAFKYIIQEFSQKLEEGAKWVQSKYDQMINNNELNQDDQQQEYSVDSFIVEQSNQFIPQDIKKKKKGMSADWMFPQQFQKNNKLLTNNPSLQLIRYTINIIKVNDNFDPHDQIGNAFQKIRKQLIKNRDLNPLSTDNIYKPLKQKIQMNCSMCYSNFPIVYGSKQDKCPICQNQFNEQQFNQKVQQEYFKQLMIYQIQDLYCQKCHDIRKNQFDMNCLCGGKYVFSNDGINQDRLVWIENDDRKNIVIKESLEVMGF